MPIKQPRKTTPAFEPDGDTREKILLGAARLFRHHGYAGATLRDVALACDIKAGSIYYYFESKDQILGEVLDRGVLVVSEAVRSRLQALPAGATPRERLSAAIEGHLWGMLHNGDFTSANIRIYSQVASEARLRHRKVRRAYADYWDRILEEALKSGELRSNSSVPVVRMFIIGALNWTVEWYNPKKGSFEDFVKQVRALVFDGVFEDLPLRRNDTK